MSFDFLKVKHSDLGKGSSIKLVEVETVDKLFVSMALSIYTVIKENNDKGRRTVLILPVGPVGQYEYLVDMINSTNLSLNNTFVINMDEYLDENDRYISYQNPLSFIRKMDDMFYNKIKPELNVPKENRHFPDPQNLEATSKFIENAGGVDVCFGGVGVNGHLAFNEPIEDMSAAEFAQLPTRVIDIAIETIVLNAIYDMGGYFKAMPKRAVTIGMKEILGSKKIMLYMLRDWQLGTIRAAVHGEISAQMPASLVQKHSDCTIVYSSKIGSDIANA